MRRILATAAAALAVAGATAQAGDVQVEVGHNRIAPAELTVAVGDKVVFTNTAKMPGGHTLKSDDGAFESPPLDVGQSWTFEPPGPGPYTFHIVQHPDAKATVHVTGLPLPPAEE